MVTTPNHRLITSLGPFLSFPLSLRAVCKLVQCSTQRVRDRQGGVGWFPNLGSTPSCNWAVFDALRLTYSVRPRSLSEWPASPLIPEPHCRTCSTLGCRSRSSSTISLSSLWAARR